MPFIVASWRAKGESPAHLFQMSEAFSFQERATNKRTLLIQPLSY
jgi:hypothetical protein